MKLCKTHQPLPNNDTDRWHRRALKDHQHKGAIYVHSNALADFARSSLPRLKTSFVLVSGDSVRDISPRSIKPDLFKALVDHPLLESWFAQNLSVEHPKLRHLPLGLDYHTIAAGAQPDWGPSASPRAQEDVLHTIRHFGFPLKDRSPLGYSNWQFKLAHGDRSDVINALSRDSSYFEEHPVPRTESWRRNSEYFFTISPRGCGMDCHRTWEAILLGSVPIIPDLPINALFKTLPVTIVKDWAQVTPAFLASEKERILSEKFDFATVLLKTWKRRINCEVDHPSLILSYQDFMRLGPKDF